MYCVLHTKPSNFADAGMYEAICIPATFTSAGGQNNISGNIINVSLAFIRSLTKVEFPLIYVKKSGYTPDMFIYL
jgi:hypothetical protein